MKKSFFRNTFILYIAVLIISVLFINYQSASIVRDSHISSLKNNLFAQLSVISGIVPDGPIQPFALDIKEKVSARITMIDTAGNVLADSDENVSSMDNHANRPEIQQALTAPVGFASRFSTTQHQQMLYAAKKVERNGRHKGFIRMAVPITSVNTAVNDLRLKINLLIIPLFLLIGAGLLWQMEKVRIFISQISEYADALTHGFFKKKIYIEGAGEFTALAKNLNNMASELEETIKTRDEETKQLGVIIKSIPDALLLIGVNGTVRLSNTAARDLFGHNQLDGKPFLEIVRSPVFTELVDKVKYSRMPDSAEFTLDFPEEKHVHVRVSPLFYVVGEYGGLVAIFHDTTRMKQLEQVRRDFVANVSHEIKTPITAIKGFSETLLDGALYDRENAESFLQTIKSHSERLNRLVEDLMTISKIELGSVMINKEEFNIEDAVNSAMNTFVIHAAQKNLILKKSVDIECSKINGDRDKVEQILLNLTDNAIKFSEGGEIEIGTCPEGPEKFFYVKDSGIGVPEKYISRLGERFFRVDPSRSREQGGTGLGLAIVKHLVIAHGWEMKVESVEGKGTTVKIFY